MSVQAMGWVLKHSNATGNDRLVLLAIANAANAEGQEAWPSVETIAADARVSRRTAQRCIERLAAAGELSVEVQAGGMHDTRRDRRPNRYTVHMHGVSPVTPREANGVSPGVERGVTRDINGVSPVTERGVTAVTPEPSLTRPKAPVQRQPSGKSALPRMRAREDSTAEFDNFWTAYPRKQGKGAARKAFAKRCAEGADPLALVASAWDYREFVDGGGVESMRFVPHPTTWLNQERDGDELQQSVAEGKPSKAMRDWMVKFGGLADEPNGSGADCRQADSGIRQAEFTGNDRGLRELPG